MAKSKNHKPIPPSDIKINNHDEQIDMLTKSMGTVKISAKIDDPDDDQTKLKVVYSSNNFKTLSKPHVTNWGKSPRREEVTLQGLKTNTLYKARLYTIAKTSTKNVSNVATISFWTNRNPTVTLKDPAENSEYEEYIPPTNTVKTTLLFDWNFKDVDAPEGDEKEQAQFQIKYWPEGGAAKFIPRKGYMGGAAGKNTYYSVLVPDYFVANTHYSWTVRARDTAGLWSSWALPNSFFIRGARTPPTLLAPIGGIGTAVIVDQTVRFSWKFKDPTPIVAGVPTPKQTQADIRWRVKGTEGVDASEVDAGGWFTLFGEGTVPGGEMQWDILAGYFTPGFQYEWQMRTYDDKEEGIPSGWSTSAFFVAAPIPGYANVDPPLSEEVDTIGSLGCGHHRVFVYNRGGKVLRGEIKPIARLQWNRKRDDISNCIVDTNGFDQDCCTLLGDLQSWVHELVVFRDGVRVFEGPITRITYTSEAVEVEAKDVMGYLYRRIMRQGYNDAFRRVDLTPKTPSQPLPAVGLKGGGPYTIIGNNTVVDRAVQIALNALAYQDPNVLPYITAIRYDDDAKQSRIVPDYSRTAWEEIDDLAATAGLDYTTIGRRILFWDTNRMIGRLPEMRDGDFSDPVIVTEYGMEMSNYYAVTNNSGFAGVAYPLTLNEDNYYRGSLIEGVDNQLGFSHDYGPVEMLSSAYGEQEGAIVSTEAMTTAQRDALVRKLREQAVRGISDRWPTPVVVRVPDNTTLNPNLNLSINQLVPGVWIPLRATLTCRKFSQWQKLDSVDVEEVAGQEWIRVVMSPAPHGGDDDPDLAGSSEGI